MGNNSISKSIKFGSHELIPEEEFTVDEKQLKKDSPSVAPALQKSRKKSVRTKSWLDQLTDHQFRLLKEKLREKNLNRKFLFNDVTNLSRVLKHDGSCDDYLEYTKLNPRLRKDLTDKHIDIILERENFINPLLYLTFHFYECRGAKEYINVHVFHPRAIEIVDYAVNYISEGKWRTYQSKCRVSGTRFLPPVTLASIARGIIRSILSLLGKLPKEDAPPSKLRPIEIISKEVLRPRLFPHLFPLEQNDKKSKDAGPTAETAKSSESTKPDLPGLPVPQWMLRNSAAHDFHQSPNEEVDAIGCKM